MRRMLGQIAHRLFPGVAAVLRATYTLAFDHGQRRSSAVNAAGEPIPWYTYPAIEYLSQLDARELAVFEFGAGSSSLFWAARARRVCSVESDRAWHARLTTHRVPNLEIFLREEKQGYVDCLAGQKEPFDVIVIDGRWRRACARLAPQRLRDGGLIVLDNTDWHPLTAADLRAAGFLQIDFNGFGPLNAYAWTTSIFLKAHTHLKLREPAPIGGIRQVNPEND